MKRHKLEECGLTGHWCLLTGAIIISEGVPSRNATVLGDQWHHHSSTRRDHSTIATAARMACSRLTHHVVGPGALALQVFEINDSGKIAGTTYFSSDYAARRSRFVYDSDGFTPANVPGTFSTSAPASTLRSGGGAAME